MSEQKKIINLLNIIYSLIVAYFEIFLLFFKLLKLKKCNISTPP